MGRRGKKYLDTLKKVKEKEQFELIEAIEFLKANSFVGFDESVDIAMKLGVNPRHADQLVRGSVSLPHGTGKTKRVIVFALGEKVAEAKDAGADEVGSDDLVEKIREGWLDFDAAISTPDMMSKVGTLGRSLGPRGLMPNPKSGTVTTDVAKAVNEIKQGKIEFRVDKAANIHASIGKISFDTEKLFENSKALIGTIIKLRPASAKGTYLKTIVLTSTMNVGLKLDIAHVVGLLE